MAIDIARIATNLEPRPDGIWWARQQAEVSYPSTGHALCRTIEDGSFWFQHRNRVIVSAMRHLPPQGTVFDVGGGNGVVSRALLDAGYDVVLVELGADGIRSARERGLERLVCASLDQAGFLPGVLPAVGMFDVLEHMPDDAAVLATVRDLLAPGGRLYLTVPAWGFLWSEEDDAAGHHRRYTRRALVRRLAGAGLKVEFASYFFAPLPLPVLLMRALPTRLGLRGPREPDRVRREHGGAQGLAGRALGVALAAERNRIAAGRAVPFGTSCLAVARRA